MNFGMNTQRGVSYDPGASSASRKTRAKQIERDIRRLSAPKKVSPKKEEAIKRDQIEHAWRERARDRRH